ncbi:type I restriction enzyme HsdR N-terminal domain-containing protein [Pseudomonas viridiflava]|uniref:type I restriction enzyme HsdR N-terminal domain-containing protein n=1 Tax=Pseudomonas viridiflava TaxID=33069 RepID=UPI000F06FF4D|nr:type I restriction enzyme HsdR N-terminal domain-containing protein [Pseudomonas viridiflava]
MIDVSYEAVCSLDFKEDSVREEIITPILKRLGYKVEGKARISRSKPLINEFIRIGVTNHPVTTIPDYTLYYDGEAVLVIDAKNPSENINSPSHIQQAYSYAVHPEIRCQHFALCNGHRFVLFNQTSTTPVFEMDFRDYETQWSTLEKYLKPQNLKNPGLTRFASDAGIKCARMGIGTGAIHWYPAMPSHFARIDKDTITISSNVEIAGEEHCISFDVNSSQLPKILSCLPPEAAEAFTRALDTAPFQAESNHMISLDLITRLGPMITNEHETFIPFIVTEVESSRLLPPTKIKKDFPANYFQLMTYLS